MQGILYSGLSPKRWGFYGGPHPTLVLLRVSTLIHLPHQAIVFLVNFTAPAAVVQLETEHPTNSV